MKIKNLQIREIFDSAGEQTIDVSITSSTGYVFSSQIPCGKSKGSNEVRAHPAQLAKQIGEKVLRRKIVGRTFSSVVSLDNWLLKLDGTRDKRNLGGNLMLGASMTFSRALAWEKKMPLWQFLRKEFFKGANDRLPLIFSNLINGGVHANSNLDIQEYMIVVRPKRPLAASIETLIDFYCELGNALRRKSKLVALPLGDEAGYSLWFRDNFEPVRILEKLIYKMKLQKFFALGLDVAATSFYRNRKYQFAGEKLSTDELCRMYIQYFKHSKALFSIEDPFAENDFTGFSRLTADVDVKDKWIVGDDLTTTNPALISDYGRERLVNAVIIKPNQIGTVSETCQAVRAGRQSNLKIIVSHRSGETEDNFIIHLARACKADAVKIGAPARERIFKFNELLRVYS